ncbi:MAG: hypothetical protein WA096_09520 [Smithella sp.]
MRIIFKGIYVLVTQKDFTASLISIFCLSKTNFADYFCRLTGVYLYAIVTPAMRLYRNPHVSLRIHDSELPVRRMSDGNLYDVN